jgi:CRP-like cAMP-binding protein
MALPVDEREGMMRRLEPFTHRVHDPVYRQGERIESVVFPLTGVFSLVAVFDGAPPVEVATVGSEGFVGLPVFLQATLTGAHMAFSQIEGEALRMDAAEFLDVVNAAPALRDALQRYSMALMTQIARGAACNRVHAVEKRTSRWLLQTHDRVDGDHFVLRREFLAQMVGEDVDIATEQLEASGAIAYADDHVAVRDRAALERASCDCYELVRHEYDRLLSG